MEKEAKEITVPELLPGYILFYHGKKGMARKIQWFQKQKFPKEYIIYKDLRFYFWELNHVGHLDKDFADDIIVYEQDNPGKYHSNRLNEEYILDKGDVWIGVPNIHPDRLAEGMRGLRIDAENYAAEDKLLNYSYKSLLGFAVNAIYFKLFNRECWVTGIPKGTTCSQIVAKLYQKWFGFFVSDPWWSWFPSELSMSKEIELYKLIYFSIK